MSALKSIELELTATKDLALISSADDSVWLIVTLKWWDLATLIWWWLCPSDKKASVKLTLHGGAKVTCRAVRVATRHARIRGFG